MRNYVSALLGILLFTIGGCTPESNPDAEKSGIKSAEAWLEFVDSEKYAVSVPENRKDKNKRIIKRKILITLYTKELSHKIVFNF